MFILFELAIISLAPLYGVYKTWTWLNKNLTKLFVQSRMIEEVVEGKLHWSAAGIASVIVAIFLGVVTIPTLFHMLPLLQLASGIVYIGWIALGIMALYKRYTRQELTKSLKDL
jgi:hypothetical protein